MFKKNPTRCIALVIALGLAHAAQAQTPQQPPVAMYANSSQLSNPNQVAAAFSAILSLEEVLNSRDETGMYMSQVVTLPQMSDLVEPYITDEFYGVTGLGHATSGLGGYAPNLPDRTSYATHVPLNQQFAIAAAQANGGSRTADFRHTLVHGWAQGNLATMIFNFELLGSFVDAEGNRLPVVNPWIPNLEGTGGVPFTGRCICVCERVGAHWKMNTFYFVLSPRELLFQ